MLVCNSATDIHASVIIPHLDNAGIITGAVVGAVTVVGGIVLIAALTMLFYCCQKKAS